MWAVIYGDVGQHFGLNWLTLYTEIYSISSCNPKTDAKQKKMRGLSPFF